MVHSQQDEESSSKTKSRDAKRARSFYCGSSKGMLEIKDNPRFKKRLSNNVPFK